MVATADEFKAGLRTWASGVTIVTSRAGEKIHGMTVSAFSSVSLDPPLVLVCAEKKSETLKVIEQSRCFAVNILAEGQEQLSNRFASKKDEHRRFEGVETDVGKTGAPLLRDAHASLDCRVQATHDGGDHVIYVGLIELVKTRDVSPLLFYQGQYGTWNRTET